MLIIHIGFHKTGSTAIQSFLENNRNALEENGLLIPRRLSSWLGHPEVAWSLDQKNYPWQDQAYDPADIEKHYRSWLEISQEPDTKVILSSEEFCRLEYDLNAMARLREFLGQYNPLIVGYVRKPADFLLSRYRHEVQMGGERRTLVDFVANFDNLQSAAFHMRTRIWEQVFPESCIFRDFGTEFRNAGSILHSFLKLIEYGGPSDKLIPENSEQKLHPVFLDAVRALVRSSLDGMEKGEIFDELFRLSGRISSSLIDKEIDQLSLPSELRTLLSSLSLDGVNLSRTVGSILAARNAQREFID
jgi:hypothetical protein